MTRLSRGAMLVRALDALRAFHGHVAFCDTCHPVIEEAAGKEKTLTLAQVKERMCSVGRSTMKAAFKATGKSAWTTLEPSNVKVDGGDKDSQREVAAAVSTQVATPAIPETDRGKLLWCPAPNGSGSVVGEDQGDSPVDSGPPPKV